MRHAGRGLVAASVMAGLLVAGAVPALAGDAAPTNGSVIGDWRTRTDGVRQTVTFDSEGKVFGNAGCNRFTGGYTVKGDRIMIGPLATTMMFCEGKMDAERAFLTSLEDAVDFMASATRLKIRTSSDTITFKSA